MRYFVVEQYGGVDRLVDGLAHSRRTAVRLRDERLRSQAEHYGSHLPDDHDIVFAEDGDARSLTVVGPAVSLSLSVTLIPSTTLCVLPA